MCLTHEHHLNGVVVDDAALEVMLRIEKTMQRLEVMGDDEQRWLWIELKAPGKRNRMETADANGNYWYQVFTANYKGFHYMIIRNRQWRYVDLRSASSIWGERNPDVWYGNVSKSLLKLEKHITALVDNICENADEYNTYVEKNLPYSKRDGIIKRADLNRICPVYRTFDDPARVVDIVKKSSSLPLWSADKMTLRTYIHVWRILYEAYRTHDSYRPALKSDFANESDEEVFVRHNSKGREIKGLDLDCEQDYQKWYDDNSSYHCMDVAYARIHLHARKKTNRWGNENVPVADGQWYFSLGFCVYGYSNDVVNMLEALCDEGIGVVCGETARLVRIAEETDYVGITPSANKYSYDEKVGNEITLPYMDEDITAQQVADVIAATEWEPIRKVKPINEQRDLHMELYDNSRYLKTKEFDANGDVLVLAGDTFYLRDIIAPQKKFWNWASKNFRQVLMVPGNHEFYGNGDVTERGDSWQWMFRENVGYYYNKVVRIVDTDFILTTLWSKIPEMDMFYVLRGMNDFRGC